MPRVVHFEIQADIPKRAVDFYTQVFNWEITKWDNASLNYWIVKTGEEQPGINGGIMERQGPAPSEGSPVVSFVCTVEVPSVDDYVQKVKNAGGLVSVPKMAIPTVGWIAYCRDTEGNIFGLMESDEEAR